MKLKFSESWCELAKTNATGNNSPSSYSMMSSASENSSSNENSSTIRTSSSLTDTVDYSSLPHKQPKGLKQSSLKRLSHSAYDTSTSLQHSSTKRKYRNRTNITIEVTGSHENLKSKSTRILRSPTSPTHSVSTCLLGNIHFSCVKRDFKCAECNQTDLMSHYK